MGNWHPRREQRSECARNLDEMRSRSEDLTANDGHAASCVDTLALNVAGSGMRPQSYPDINALGITEEQGQTFADSAERAWGLWTREADAAGICTFEDLQYQAIRSMFVTGEVLHQVVWAERPGRSFGMALQALHPARLRTPSDRISDKNIFDGVQLGDFNEPIGYWIANPDMYDNLSGLSSNKFSYVPRKIGHRFVCFHLYHCGMPEQMRGVSILSAALKQFHDLSDYIDYQLVGAMIAASFTVFIKHPANVWGGMASFNGTKSDPSRQYETQIQPGTMITGNDGDEPVLLSSDRPGPTFDAFYERMLRGVSASTGQPYELVAKDFSKTNYSSARAALLEVWKLHSLYQSWFIRGYLDRIWSMVLEEALIRGMLVVPSGAPSPYRDPMTARAWLNCIWSRPPRGQVDAVKERNAEKIGLDTLTDTRTAICHSHGIDFETLVRTRAREERLIKESGLNDEPEQPEKDNDDNADAKGVE